MYLWDVLSAADDIAAFVADIGVEDYAADRMRHSAVERQFEIIGEAINQLSKIDSSLASRIPHTSRAVRFRNRLIHGYFTVDHTLVFSIARDDLPLLRQAVDTLLKELGDVS